LNKLNNLHVKKNGESSKEKCPLVKMVNISKSFGHVQALKSVSFDLYHNEVLGLIGDNAAGKSTLMKILVGVLKPDGGEILIDGKRVNIDNPSIARKFGINMIFQDFAVCKSMWVAGNIFLGQEPTKGFFGKIIGLLDKNYMLEKSISILDKQGVDSSICKKQVGSLSGGQQQSIAVARAVGFATKIVIMDEPTASLGVNQSNRLMEIIKKFKKNGISVIYISHRMQDVFNLTNRIIVLKNGEKIGDFHTKEVSYNDIIELMVENKQYKNDNNNGIE